MRKYFLAPDAHLVSIDRYVVVLQLLTHKYLALDCTRAPQLLAALKSATSHELGEVILVEASSDGDANDLSELVSKGILLATPSRTPRFRKPIPTPLHSLVSIPTAKPEPVPLRAVARFLLSYLSVRIGLRVAGLPLVVDRLRTLHADAPERASPEELERARRVVRTFCRIRPWIYTAHEHCLMDSLVLVDFMHRHRLPGLLMIGTCPMPFSAHAWVQLGDCVIDDPVETVRMYLPILFA